MDIRYLPVQDRWCVHSYYTLCPYAPDGSRRLLLAGADLERGGGEVLILDGTGSVIDRFGENPLHTGFYHTGWWQTWSADAKTVYYQSGTLSQPCIVKRDLASGTEQIIEGDMEGAPPNGEPIISGLMGMLYAAGYGTMTFSPETAPVPFQARDQHGLFAHRFDPQQSTLILSVAEVLDRHPQRDLLRKEDRAIKARLGQEDGLTLMTYCVRWSPTGERFLFYFGNHNVVKERGEPRLAYVFTADRALQELHLAVDISYERRGVHWDWHPDGEHLLGYGPDPDDITKRCLVQVRYDGSDYRKISDHNSGGHPSISPTDHNLLVTDETGSNPGAVVFIDTRDGHIIERHHVSRVYGDTEPRGRNPYRVCHHPVFDREGRKVLINTLEERHAVVAEMPVPGVTL